MILSALSESVLRLAGHDDLSGRPWPPFAPPVLAFLGALSAALRADPEAKGMGDVQTFAFWCRTVNLERLRDRHRDRHSRLGRGMVLHIAPSNVPINFAYSLAFGLLAGDTNAVRVSGRSAPAVSIVCRTLDRLLAEPAHAGMAGRLAIVEYPAESDATARLSAVCAARTIWGGDDTVARIKAFPTPPRAVDVAFPDRWSLCLMSPEAVEALSPPELDRLADAFFNDAYLMDQNACSSPQLVVWLGEAPVPERFWAAVHRTARRRYALLPVQAVDKYTQLLLEAAADPSPAPAMRYGTLVYVVILDAPPESADRIRGRFGLFHQCRATSLEPLESVLSAKAQTLAYFGVDGEAVRDFVLDRGLFGVDRIVPVGQALDMDLLWDGYDLVAHLSRIVDLR